MSVRGIGESAVPTVESRPSRDAGAKDGAFASVLANVTDDARGESTRAPTTCDDESRNAAPAEAQHDDAPAPTQSADAADPRDADASSTPARDVSVAELELARAEHDDAGAPMYDAIATSKITALPDSSPPSEPDSRGEFADALAASTEDDDDTREALPESSTPPTSEPTPSATIVPSTNVHIDASEGGDDVESIATEGAPTAVVASGEPAAATTREAATATARTADTAAPIADARTDARGPIRAATQTRTGSARAAVRAAIRHADAPTTSADAPAPAAAATPRIGAATEATPTPSTSDRTQPSIAGASTNETSAPSDVPAELAAPQHQGAAPSSSHSRASTPFTAEPVMLSRAEDLATAIDRLRPIPKGGAVIEVQTPGLGTMRVEVAIDDGNVRIRIDSDDARALAWIESEQHGITAAARQSLPEASNVQLELRQQGGDPRHRTPQRAPEPAEPRGDAPPTPSRRGTERDAPASTPTIRRGLVDVLA